MMLSLFLDLFSFLLKSRNKKLEKVLYEKGKDTLKALAQTEKSVETFVKIVEDELARSQGALGSSGIKIQ